MPVELKWRSLEFLEAEGKICLIRIGEYSFSSCGAPLAEIQIEGAHRDSHEGIKAVGSSEGRRLRYVSHQAEEDRLTILLRSELVEAAVVFTGYEDTDAFRVHTEVRNCTDTAITLEEVSAFVLTGFGGASPSTEEITLTRFLQSHHRECQPRRQSLFDLGLHCELTGSLQNRISQTNVGVWSTKEALPQGILENGSDGSFLMFQLESGGSWYYEISDCEGLLYLYLGGASRTHCAWSKTLQPGQRYCTTSAAIALGRSLNEVMGEMTKYRRHIAGKNRADASLPVIFNEYMHLSWDSPAEETTAETAPAAALAGAEYYVIDCGWHNEEPGEGIYAFVGQWQQSNARFPHGLRKTMDRIRELGMKPGLWIEPEIIGQQCREMLEYYDDNCFLTRGGRKIAVMNRYFLDYRAPKVIDYMNRVIQRMVEEYGAAYIKLDCNQEPGLGSDSAGGFGEGLEQTTATFRRWIQTQMEKYPDVIFEACASGGMRMDYQTLSQYSLVSTSDQTSYRHYPYIAGNILSAVLPEQAAVWSYPVAEGRCDEDVSKDCVCINMVNTFLGRMHLASRIGVLDAEKQALIREGVAYYRKLSEIKTEALPYFPLGLTDFRQEKVAAGLMAVDSLYLAVWHLKGAQTVTVPIPEGIRQAKIAYPAVCDTVLSWESGSVTLTFPREEGAVFLEIELKNP